MPQIEFITLANHAEAINGLLYLTGAGWTDHWRVPGPNGDFPPFHFGIGVSILVPWTETNRRHHLELRIEDEDGDTELAKVEADLEVGRPPGTPVGSDLRSVLALNVNLVFPQAGGYRVIGEMGPDIQKTVSFSVRDQPMPWQQPAAG